MKKIIPYNSELNEYARKLRNNSTLSEILLWNEIKNQKILGYKFERQKIIKNYIVDFFCYELMLVIEIDGSTHDYKREKDEKRQYEIEKLGIKFIRYSDLDIKRICFHPCKKALSRECFYNRLSICKADKFSAKKEG